MAWKSRKRGADDDGPDEYTKDGFVVADSAEYGEDTHKPKKTKVPNSNQLSRGTQAKPWFPGDENGIPGGGVDVDGVISWEVGLIAVEL